MGSDSDSEASGRSVDARQSARDDSSKSSEASVAPPPPAPKAPPPVVAAPVAAVVAAPAQPAAKPGKKRWSRLALMIVTGYLLAMGIIFILLGIFLMTYSVLYGDVHMKDLKKEYVKAIEKLDVNKETKDIPLFSNIIDLGSDFYMTYGIANVLVCVLGVIVSCCGFKFLIKLYGVLILLEMIVLSGFLIDVYVNKTIGQKQMYESLKTYTGVDSGNALTAEWNFVMHHMQCCGVKSFKDFHDIKSWQRNSSVKMVGQKTTKKVALKTPIICCKGKIEDINCATKAKATEKNNNMNVGCYEKFYNKIYGGWKFIRTSLNILVPQAIILYLVRRIGKK